MHLLISIALCIAAFVAVLVILDRTLEDRPVGLLLLLGAAACVLGALLVASHPVQIARFFLRA